MEPKLPDHKPSYQQPLDDQYKELLKKHEAEKARYMKDSLYPSKDGVPWSEKYKEMVKRQEKELKDHAYKQAEYQKVKDILTGKIFHAKDDMKETIDKVDIKAEIAQAKPEVTYLTAKDFEQIEADLIKKKTERDFQAAQNRMGKMKPLSEILKNPTPPEKEPPKQETEREKLLRETRAQLDDIFNKKHKRGLGL